MPLLSDIYKVKRKKLTFLMSYKFISGSYKFL